MSPPHPTPGVLKGFFSSDFNAKSDCISIGKKCYYSNLMIYLFNKPILFECFKVKLYCERLKQDASGSGDSNFDFRIGTVINQEMYPFGTYGYKKTT